MKALILDGDDVRTTHEWADVEKALKVAFIEKQEAVIESGLQPGQRVVVDGQYKLQPGSKVKEAVESRASKAQGATSGSRGSTFDSRQAP